MVFYQCPKCSKIFPSKPRLRAHWKTHPNPENNELIMQPILQTTSQTVQLPTFQCEHCKKFYKRDDILKEHVKLRCKKNPNRINNNTAVLNNNNVGGSVNINNGNIDNSIAAQTVIVQNNINLMPYNTHIDMFYMSKDEIHKIFNSTENPYVVFFELVHLNLDRPQYQNLRYVDNNTVLVFMHDDWYKTDVKKVMLDIIMSERDSMVNYLSKTYTMLERKSVEKIHKTIMSTCSDRPGNFCIKRAKRITDETNNIGVLMKNSLQQYKPKLKVLYHDENIVRIKNGDPFQKKIFEDINYIQKARELKPDMLDFFIEPSDSSDINTVMKFSSDSSDTESSSDKPPKTVVKKSSIKKSSVKKTETKIDYRKLSFDSSESSEEPIPTKKSPVKKIHQKSSARKRHESGSCDSSENDKKKSFTKNAKKINKSESCESPANGKKKSSVKNVPQKTSNKKGNKSGKKSSETSNEESDYYYYTGYPSDSSL